MHDHNGAALLAQLIQHLCTMDAGSCVDSLEGFVHEVQNPVAGPVPVKEDPLALTTQKSTEWRG